MLSTGTTSSTNPLNQHWTNGKGNSTECCILPQLFNSSTYWLFLTHTNNLWNHDMMVKCRMKTVKPQTGTPWTEAYWHCSNTLCQLQGQVLILKKKNPYPQHPPLPINPPSEGELVRPSGGCIYVPFLLLLLLLLLLPDTNTHRIIIF